MTAKPAYRGYVLAVLLAGYTLSSFDRSVLNLLLEPIRIEFGASDAQLGLLSGLAFAFFYSTLSIPIATLADRWSRRKVLALSILLWTLMTALCGAAGSFAVLLLARVGVGMGQSGASPTSHSLIAGYFPPQRRATALGIFTLGAAAGSMLAGLFGGWGASMLGWRTTALRRAPGLCRACGCSRARTERWVPAGASARLQRCLPHCYLVEARCDPFPPRPAPVDFGAVLQPSMLAGQHVWAAGNRPFAMTGSLLPPFLWLFQIAYLRAAMRLAWFGFLPRHPVSVPFSSPLTLDPGR